MEINKIVYGGNPLIDLTEDSVTPQTLVKGYTAHDKSGKAITGVASPDIEVDADGNGVLKYAGLDVSSSGDATVT